MFNVVGTVSLKRFFKSRSAKDPAIFVADPRFDHWEVVTTLDDRETAVAWRDHLRSAGLEAACVADHPLDRLGRGDIYLMVPPDEWSRANEIVEGLD